MGLLDSKTRVLDTIVTLEGRKQLASGQLRVAYVSFSDSATFYKADLASGSADATLRIYLEAANLPQDQITFQADDSGRIQPTSVGLPAAVRNGQIVSFNSSSMTGSTLTGDDFSTAAHDLLTSSIDNFNKLMIVGTRDTLFELDDFAAGPKSVSFSVTDTKPISNPKLQVANINHVEALFNDVRLSRLKNFMYLPPINQITNPAVDKTDPVVVAANKLGNYRPWGSTTPLTFQQLSSELSLYERQGFSQVITFDPTSKLNRLVAQMFEINDSNMRKLDLIDFGVHRTGDDAYPEAHVYFAGKVMSDDDGIETFIHLFTLMFQ